MSDIREYFNKKTDEELEIIKAIFELEIENFDPSYDESLIDPSIRDLSFLK